MRNRFLALPLGAIVFATSSVCSAQQFTADGIQCGGSVFDVSQLSPSIFGANDFRLARLLTLEARYRRLGEEPVSNGKTACQTVGNSVIGVPGCQTVTDWHKVQLQPWPMPPDPYYVFARTIRLSVDDKMEFESARAMAHRRCLDLATRPIADSAPPQISVECGALAQAEAESDTWLNTKLDALAKKVAGNAAGPKGLAAALEPQSAAAKTSLAKTYVFYKCLAATLGMFGADDAVCSSGSGESNLFLGRVWGATTADINAAAAKVPVPAVLDRPVGVPRPGSEEEAVQRNFVNCHNANLYVSPTHELVRHLVVDHVVDEHFTVCVDTSGFAVDAPVQLSISTPNAQQIEWLWPGEPKEIHLETSMLTGPQVVNLTIGGYPRREILRSLARHSGGPLESKDIFGLLQQAAKDGADKGPSLVDFSKKITGDKDTVAALTKLSDLLNADPTKQKVDDVKAAARAALASVLELGKTLSTAQNKALVALLPTDDQLKATFRMDQLSPLATKITHVTTALEGTAPPAKDPDIALAAAELCRVVSEVVPIISEDVLVDGRGRSPLPYVLEYDFAGGFELSSPRDLTDADPVFIVVRNVQPKWSVRVGIDNRSVAQRDTTLVGLSQTSTKDYAVSVQTGTSRQAFSTIEPLNREMQPPSTQIIALGKLGGGARYDLTICGSSGADDCLSKSTTSSSSARVIGKILFSFIRSTIWGFAPVSVWTCPLATTAISFKSRVSRAASCVRITPRSQTLRCRSFWRTTRAVAMRSNFPSSPLGS